jgi:hypothetical protein
MKTKIYTTLIIPPVLCAYKLRCPTQKEMRMIPAWEARILRKLLLEPKKDDEEWKIRANQELKRTLRTVEYWVVHILILRMC